MNQLLSCDIGNIAILESQVEVLLKENDGLPMEARKLYETTLKAWRDTVLGDSTEKPLPTKVGNLLLSYSNVLHVGR